MTLKTIIAAMAAAAICSSCGSSDTFKVSGEIKDAGAKTVELMYCPAGAVKRITVRAVDGKFTIEGEAPQPSLAFLSVSGGAPIATLIVENGEEIECVIDSDHPFEAKIEGSDANEELYKFLNDNAATFDGGNIREINAAVADFVGKHRSSYAATAALVTRFHTPDNEIAADSLMSLIAPEVKNPSVLLNFTNALATQLSAESHGDISAMALLGRNDSTVRYNPYRQTCTLLAFVGEDRACRDSVLPALRRLATDYPKKRLQTLEISTAADSAGWKHLTERDSATWTQAWAPGTVAAPTIRRMAVATVPYFIVADSTGRQLHRGSSVAAADKAVRDYIESKIAK